MKRLSIPGTTYCGHGNNTPDSVIEEERDTTEKMDVRAAVKRRKEIKSQKRASMVELGRRRASMANRESAAASAAAAVAG
jgi:hypothetical protein